MHTASQMRTNRAIRRQDGSLYAALKKFRLSGVS